MGRPNDRDIRCPMTWTQRRYFVPGDAITDVHNNIAIALHNAQVRTREAADRLRQEGEYLVTDPWPTLTRYGTYAESAARDAWDAIRDTHDLAIRTWNCVKTLYDSPCDDKWTVGVETFLPAAGSALWLFLTPSPSEIVEEYLSPRTLRSERKGASGNDGVRRKKGRSGRVRRSWLRIPDVDKLIADVIPGATAVRGRLATAPDRWTFKAIDVADRFLWYYLLYEAGNTLLSTWNTQLREARFCSATWYTQYRGHVDQYNVAEPHLWADPENISVLHNAHGAFARMQTGADPGTTYEAKSGIAIWQCTVGPNPDGSWYYPAAFTLTAYDRFGNFRASDRVNMTVPAPGEFRDFTLVVDMKGAAFAQAGWLSGGGPFPFIYHTDATLYAEPP